MNLPARPHATARTEARTDAGMIPMIQAALLAIVFSAVALLLR